MSGYKIVIPGRFTNKALPVLGEDPLLNAGSLLLVEPGHPSSPYRGALADGDLLENIAWREAQALAGGTQATLSARLENPSDRAWVTSKGGIQWSTGPVVGAHLPLPVLEYLRQNPMHEYRAVWWGGLVEGTGGINGRLSVVHFDAAEAVSSIYWDMIGNSSGNVDASNTDIPNTNLQTGPRRHSVGSGSTRGPITATAAEADKWSRIFGYGIGKNSGPASGQAVFHRFYLEDLTVSGRASTELNAIDRALYVKHMLTPGGRYHGESYTPKTK